MVVSDRGTEFRYLLMKRISHLFKVNQIATAPYNPRSNWLVENHNSTLRDQLYHYVESRQNDWGSFLPTVQLMEHTTATPATAYMPHYLMLGRECIIPAMEGMLGRIEEPLGLDTGMDEGTQQDQTVYER